ncbi:hypothetical protein Q5O14_08290 [Eubacteriaceae bacterium ES2]|uniref:Uncharacterized protein n=1 Tax=Acetobacterium wieringae TaxID=52694 RepID=A0A1F2PCR6_9FIRM|nr:MULTISPECIES: hypothetical protein [Acetobacterium]AWW25920.1 hypothetical protein DOZ58_04230 [Acetobacterium sp. KB-1]OFV69147.1 hypothetical protein ACWI_33410 [Acetobacterium wieringae]OXS26176.1 MAG: hypothetical protein BI182_14965 [Acetobacterium sp. MES1]WKY46081.1 hypothetical protein Q5O14_08290 [Eubacteriaceae bacterium ES2]
MKVKDILIMGLPGIVMGFIMSFIISYFVIGIPENEIANAINNGISGLVSTFLGVLMTFVVNKQKIAKCFAEVNEKSK